MCACSSPAVTNSSTSLTRSLRLAIKIKNYKCNIHLCGLQTILWLVLFFCFLQRQLSAVQSSDKGLLWGMIRPHCFQETHHPEFLVVFLNITMNLLTIHIGSNHELYCSIHLLQYDYNLCWQKKIMQVTNI